MWISPCLDKPQNNYKNTNTRCLSAPNIRRIHLPRRNMEHQHKNHFIQMNPIPLAPMESTTFKKCRQHTLLFTIRQYHNSHVTLNISKQKPKAKTQTITNLNQLLDYLGTHPAATIRYYFIRHDPQRTFRCILIIINRYTQQRSRKFLPQMDNTG